VPIAQYFVVGQPTFLLFKKNARILSENKYQIESIFWLNFWKIIIIMKDDIKRVFVNIKKIIILFKNKFKID
jgi:hypothetical protein